LLLAWGTLVGIDLASVQQMMIARPLVAGVVSGAILGDVGTGLRLGVVFELLQHDIVHLGAVRYPEYGPATVAGVSAAHAAGRARWGAGWWWRPGGRVPPSRRGLPARSAWWPGRRRWAGSPRGCSAAPPLRGSSEAAARAYAAAPLHGAGLVELRAHAGRGLRG